MLYNASNLNYLTYKLLKLDLKLNSLGLDLIWMYCSLNVWQLSQKSFIVLNEIVNPLHPPNQLTYDTFKSKDDLSTFELWNPGGLEEVTWRSEVSGCWWLLHSRCSSSQTSPVPTQELQKAQRPESETYNPTENTFHPGIVSIKQDCSQYVTKPIVFYHISN